MRLIDSNVLYDKIQTRYKGATGDFRKAYSQMLDDICDAQIVEPVKRGKWVKTTKWWQHGSLWKICSVCKTLNYKSPYCPHCGAKMDLE